MSRVACLCLIVCLLCGCLAAGEADQGEEVSGQGVHTCVVNPSSGADTAPPSGQLCETSKTITFQLAQLAKNGSTGVQVIVEPGTYTSASEQFPIVVPNGVALQGDNSPGAAPVILQGSGTYTSTGGGQFQATVVLRGAGELINVQIQSDQIGLLLDSTVEGAAVQNVDIQPCLRGMVTLGTSVAAVDALNVNQCQNTGIETHDTSAVTFTNSSTIANQVGVLAADQSQPDFGSDNGGSNTFAANVQCDFESQTSATLNLVGNSWDNNVFDIFPQSVCANGAELVVAGTGNVIYQYLPNQNIPLFPATEPIALLSPQYGSFLNTTEPSFAWTAGSSSNQVALAVWDTAPDVGPDGIRNANHIVLFWQSGLPTGSVGNVAFSDMRTPVAGDVTNLQPPQPLIAGRPYYWSVWQWDSAGVQVAFSSDVSVFTVRLN
jgi:hypothetical protein